MRKIAGLSRRNFLIAGAGGAASAILLAEGCDVGSLGKMMPNPQPANNLFAIYVERNLGGKTLRTRTYNGTIPGPTLVTAPGAAFAVSVGNQLPPNPPESVPASIMVHPMSEMDSMRGRVPLGRGVRSTNIDPMNNPHSFNTTNLHVHGLQVVPHIFEPIGTTDPNAMMLAIEPGQRRVYNFTLPADHPSGLYWYHPHHHGSTDIQVGGGMAGLIIVQGPIDAVPEIAAARDIRIAVQTLNLDQDPKTGIYTNDYVAYQTPQNGGYTPRPNNMFVLVNGQLVNLITGLTFAQAPPETFVSTPSPPPQVQMQPGEVVRLRILNGSNEMFFPLQLLGFEVYVIAYDGINLLAPLKIDQTGSNSVQIASGNRVEMLVRAPATAGTYTLSALSVSAAGLHPWPQLDLMQFVVSGSQVSMGIPSSLPKPAREYPPIADSEISGNRTVTFNATGGSTAMLAGVALTVNTQSYNEMSIMFNATVGTAEEWTLINLMPEGHPFHIHTNSFEVLSVTGLSGPTNFSYPYIADTVWIPANGQAVIRTRYKDWRGKEVFHCHKISHEDQGMMANIMLR